MDYDTDKVDGAALALLFLTMHSDGFGLRAWKALDWDVTDRLHAKGFIHDPKGKSKSVSFTDEGARRSEELFRKLFGKVGGGTEAS